MKKKEKSVGFINKQISIMIALAVLITVVNQLQLGGITGALVMGSGRTSSTVGNVIVAELLSTGHTLAAVYPLETINLADDAMAMLFPSGTPAYGADLGVSFDEPIDSLAVLARMYRSLKTEVQTNNPDGWTKFMNLASKPVGISCEYCCGIGPIGVKSNGDSACGCQHNPALLTVALYLSAYTDYSDGEILQEVMKWKTLFFPKDMIKLGLTIAGEGTEALSELPGMVGGC